MGLNIYTAASGCITQERSLEVIANNLANVNSPGYKRDVPSFNIWFKMAGNDPIRNVGSTPSIPVILERTRTDFSQGSIRDTGNPFDLALQGDGFFAVQTPEGVRYTRNGAISMDRDNRLVTSEGYPLLGKGGPIVVKGQGLVIDKKGTVKVDDKEVDRLKIVKFEDPQLLRKIGMGLFEPTSKDVSADEAEDVTVLQGSLELPNIEIIREMVKMIEITRTYEAQQKVLKTLDEVSQKAVNDLGRV